MEQPLSSRPSLRTILVVLVLALALALAAAVSRVVVSSGTGGSQPSQGPGHTSSTSGPSYVLARDARTGTIGSASQLTTGALLVVRRWCAG